MPLQQAGPAIKLVQSLTPMWEVSVENLFRFHPEYLMFSFLEQKHSQSSCIHQLLPSVVCTNEERA